MCAVLGSRQALEPGPGQPGQAGQRPSRPHQGSDALTVGRFRGPLQHPVAGQNPQPGPLYNTFDWGGFLTWYMPDHPVAIDGRTDLYGDEMDLLFFRTENGDSSYADDPYLNESGVILVQSKKPLARVLNGDQRFKKIYEDRLAVVFVRR